ncbi:hypothetical protein [Maricaulis maris]|uniref:Uncharacterized protein n=1 Tax=Maricaulis maris TaxID=74318 RepID=A0A495DJA3_9PROT|nr:hypothetical protein [Maricaulis maris]RKR02693.1 hypothetical protein C7435_0632 [Maricaulis maris]
MARANISPIWLEAYRTFDEIERRGLALRLTCRKCDIILSADLAVLIWSQGRAASPIDLHPRCKRWGCDGRMFFQAQVGTVWRPLISG